MGTDTEHASVRLTVSERDDVCNVMSKLSCSECVETIGNKKNVIRKYVFNNQDKCKELCVMNSVISTPTPIIPKPPNNTQTAKNKNTFMKT